MRHDSALGQSNIGIEAAKSRPMFNFDSIVDGLSQSLLAIEVVFFSGLHGNTSQQKLNLL